MTYISVPTRRQFFFFFFFLRHASTTVSPLQGHPCHQGCRGFARTLTWTYRRKDLISTSGVGPLQDSPPSGTSAGSVRLSCLLTFRQAYSLKPPGTSLGTLPCHLIHVPHHRPPTACPGVRACFMPERRTPASSFVLPLLPWPLACLGASCAALSCRRVWVGPVLQAFLAPWAACRAILTLGRLLISVSQPCWRASAPPAAPRCVALGGT